MISPPINCSLKANKNKRVCRFKPVNCGIKKNKGQNYCRANKNFQVAVINNYIKEHGMEPDLFDLRAEIDPTLRLDENLRIIKNKLKLGSRRGFKSMHKVERYLYAQDINNLRKPKSKFTDFFKDADKTFEMNNLTKRNLDKWLKHPNKYDIGGIDTSQAMENR